MKHSGTARAGASLWRQLSLRVVAAALLAIVLVGLPATALFRANSIRAELDNRERLMEGIVEQVDQNLEIAYSEGQRLSNDVELDRFMVQHTRRGEDKTRAIALKLGNFVTYSPARLLSIVIRTSEGVVFSGGGIKAQELDIFNSEAYRLYQEQGRQKLYANPVYYIDHRGIEKGYISCILPLSTLNGVTGDMVLNIDLTALESDFRAIRTDADEYLWLGYEAQPLYTQPGATPALLDPAALKAHTLTEYTDYALHLKDGGTHTLLRHSQASQWVLAAGFTNHNLMRNSQWMLLVYFLALVLSVGIILAAALVVSRRRLRPLEQLNRTMRQVSEGKLEVHSSVASNDEVGALSNTFNYMLAELRRNIDDLLLREKEEGKMRFSLLISQINPHFVYNTLNTVTYLARLGRTEDVLTVNTALIKILRDTLRVDGIHIMDTVAHEAEVVSQYITIQRYRFGEEFAVHWEIEDGLEGEMIPKNVLQPLVENALQHGLRSREEESADAAIHVRVFRQAEKLILQVEDNGAGMPPEKRDALLGAVDSETRGEHIGIENIRERITHLYGDAGPARFEIESRLGEGTVVTLRLDRSPPTDA